MFRIKLVSWKDIRDTVHKVNKKIASIIDEIDPPDTFRLYVADYSFGQIIDDGIFSIEKENGELEKITHIADSTGFKNDFEYSGTSIPAGLLLEGCVELFLDCDGDIIPKHLYTPGDIFALMRKLEQEVGSFHPLRLMKISSGARSLFLLPNIGDQFYHANLVKKFQVDQKAPQTLSDQWQVFKKISNGNNIQDKWKTSLLLFTNKWMDKIKTNDPAWLKLKVHIFSKLWEKTGFWRNRMFVDYAFSLTQKRRNMKSNPYLIETLKHIVAIIAGDAPGFTIADDNRLAPISLIKDIYLDDYRMEKYYPLIIQPSYFAFNDNNSIYYSLQHPTSYVFSLKPNNQIATLSNLRELKYITEYILSDIANQMHEFRDTTFERIDNECIFDFYHSKPDSENKIKSTKQLFNDDAKVAKIIHDKNQFASNGTFIRGCVKISTIARKKSKK